MRNFLYYFLALIALTVCSSEAKAQDKFKLSGEEETIYKLGKQYNDYSVAIRILYQKLAEDEDNLAIKDSMATLYFNSRSYPQAIAVAEDILQEQPKNKRMLEISAISYQNLGAVKKALETYEELFEASQDIYHLYQIAVLRYRIKRYGECELAVEKLIQNPQSDKEKVTINMEGSPSQNVPVKAAAYNVRGMMAFSQNEFQQAKQAFQQATEVYPEFKLAKRNLQEIKKAQGKQNPGRANPRPGMRGGQPSGQGGQPAQGGAPSQPQQGGNR